MRKIIKNIYETYGIDNLIFVVIAIIGCFSFLIFVAIKSISNTNEKKANWEQTQITYQCELKEVDTTTNSNLYTCKNIKDDTNIINIENSFDLNSNDKAKLKNQCKIIGMSKKEKNLYELSCDNEKIKVLTYNLNDFLAK